MKLLVVTHSLVRLYGDRLYVQGGFGRHLDAFAARFDHVYVLTCVRKVKQPPDEYFLRLSDLTVIPVPSYETQHRLVRYVLMLRAMFIAALKLPRAMKLADVVHPRLPCVIGSVGTFFAKFTNKPTFIYVAGDWEATLQNRSPEWLMPRIGSTITQVFRYLIGGKLCFVAGDALLQKLANGNGMVRSVFTTALGSEHILDVMPPLRPLDREVKLLFVGAASKAKGIDYLLTATATMAERGINIHLRIIGRTDDEGRALSERLAQLRLTNRVTYINHIAWDCLIWEYEKSDIFVLPSITEGIPKVVLEAMARGVPVIATNVGGVATLVQDTKNGLLIEPKSVDAIVRAVQRLIHEDGLRARLITNGLETARQRTLAKLINGMIIAVFDHYPQLVVSGGNERFGFAVSQTDSQEG